MQCVAVFDFVSNTIVAGSKRPTRHNWFDTWR